MKEIRLTLPELSLIVGTRAALGGGVALLLADRLDKEQRKSVGLTLFLLGVVSTIPLLMLAFGKRR
jgi:EamA domain-containing membrane protein RarD